MSAFHDAEFGIDDGRVLNDDVERLVGILAVALIALAVAQGFSGADQELMAIDGVVVFDLGEEAGIAQPHQIALGRPVEFGVFGRG